MNVVHCIHGLRLGGAQQIVRQIVAGGDRGRFLFFVYCSIGGPGRLRVEEAGATVRVIPRRIPKFDPLWLAGLRAAMIRDRIDIVHTHLFGDSLHGWLAAASLGLPVVMTLHCEPRWQGRFQRWGYGRILPKADRVVGCSDSVSEAWALELPVLRSEITTIPNGVDLTVPALDDAEREEMRRELGIPPHSVVVAAIGRLAPEKDLPLLIRGFSGCERRESILLFVGDGPEEQHLRSLVRERGIVSRTVFAGLRSDVLRILSVVDVMVFASRSEGLSIALLEAMAAGKCVVGSTTEGIRSVVQHEHEALLVTPGDESALQRALERTIEDRELRARLGRNAQQTYRERYTGVRMVRAYQSLYAELIEERRKQSSQPELHDVAR